MGLDCTRIGLYPVRVLPSRTAKAPFNHPLFKYVLFLCFLMYKNMSILSGTKWIWQYNIILLYLLDEEMNILSCVFLQEAHVIARVASQISQIGKEIE
jgi:hypothetical protein